jgi:asparagine synthase (glutamine-hydrolysing)
VCGIAGILHFDGEPAGLDVLRRMTDVQAHRGPDDEGVYVDPAAGLGLGHRRLSIIDLSSAGHQPMCYLGRYWITYNGEVYNYLELRDHLETKGHRFRTETDTEVILAAYAEWGGDALQRLNGMWGLAIWDAKERVLFCARDRFGVKPFYYFTDGRRFVFASEIKAVAEYLRRTCCAPVAPNHERVCDYLISGGVSDYTPETFFEGVRALPPAHYLWVRDGQVELNRYYSIDPDNELKLPSGEAYAERFAEVLEDSVRLRLRSDVPVGSCLSGGLDSSAIVCLANRLLFPGGPGDASAVGEKQKTFSSAYAEYQKYDERQYISEVISQTRAEGHYVFPSGRRLFSEDIEKLVWHQEEPFPNLSPYAQFNVFRLASEQGMKVMLDGQGADEMLGGYHGFYLFYFLDLARQYRVGRLAREMRHYCRLHKYPAIPTALHLTANVVRTALPQKLQRRWRGWRQAKRHPLFTIRRQQPVTEEGSDESLRWRTRRGYLNEALHRATIKSSLLPILRYEDRNSMAFSIEARVPFLDYRLVEFLFSLPAEQKLREGYTKIVQRRGMQGVMPEKIVRRTDKIGFPAPDAEWFRADGRDFIRDLFSSKPFAERGYFDVNNIRASFEDFCDRPAQAGISAAQIWTCVNMELWSRSFFDRDYRAPRAL